MLKVFRDNLKYLSWILWLVIVVFILFVFVDFGGGIPGGTSANDAAASVGGEEVSVREFERRYRLVEDQLREAYGRQFTPELAQQLRLPFQVLEELVVQRILAREAGRLGLEATDEEVRRAILEIPGMTGADGRFIGTERYDEILRANGLTPEDFEHALRRDLLVEKLQTVLQANVHVPEEEVERAYREQAERAKVRYVALPLAQFREGLAADPAEVEAYFASHPDEFRLPEKRVADYLLVDAAELQAGIEIEDAEARAYYGEHREEFTQDEQVRARHILVPVDGSRTEEEARQRLAEARERLAAGEDFAAVARDLSEDPGSKDRGGDLGFFGRGRMMPEFEEAAFASPPGEVVGPIETPFGLHLLEVTGRRPEGLQPFDEVAEQVRLRLASEQSATMAEAKARELADLLEGGEVGPERLQELAAEHPAVRFASTPAFARDEAVPGIGRANQFTQTAFALDQETVSEPLRLPQGWVVLTVREVQEPRIPELSEAEPQVRERVLREKARDVAEERLARVKSEVAGGGTLEEAAAALGVEVQETPELGGPQAAAIPGLGPAPELVEAALALDEGGVGGPLPVGERMVLFQVSERKRYRPEEFAAQRQQLRAQLEQERLQRLLATLIEERRQELEITYNQDLLRSLGVPDEALGA